MPTTLARPDHAAKITDLLRQFPVVAVLGARQVGKTSLAHQVAGRQRGRATMFDLEGTADLVRLSDPLAALRREHGLVVIDEVLERDIPQFGLRIPAPALRRFWTMIAHYHAQTWNGSELARAFGVAQTSVRRYLDVLTETFMVRQLAPWHANLSKRQVRSPKVYLRDTGLLHSLLGVHTARDLEGHPKVGASWEGFALGVVLDCLGARAGEAYFWATHAGAELDLLVVRGGTRLGFEFKRTSAPTVTPSMRTALTDLQLERLDVIHGGTETFPLGDRIRAVPLHRVVGDVAALR